MSEFSACRSFTPTIRSTKTLQEYEKNEAKERRRSLLYLIASYLRERNLEESADVLTAEAQLTSQYEVCDNIDLDIVFQDYQSYYNTRFHKMPKALRKVAEHETPTPVHRRKTPAQKSFSVAQNLGRNQQEESVAAANFRIDVTGLSQKEASGGAGGDQENERILNSKALCDFKGYNGEWRAMAELIIREIVPKNLGTCWADCVGVQDSIELLKEAVVYPVRYPELFAGLTAPWRGVLLYGPPGTGKTHLAKAVACESDSTFINVRSSSFISKWRGESEKMLKVLFDVAKYYAPTTIFVDEVDAIASRQDDCSHDASRRFKSELLIQMDGILNENEQVFVLATTNAPWTCKGQLRKPLPADVFKAIEKTNATTKPDVIQKYADWQKSYGSQ